MSSLSAWSIIFAQFLVERIRYATDSLGSIHMPPYSKILLIELFLYLAAFSGFKSDVLIKFTGISGETQGVNLTNDWNLISISSTAASVTQGLHIIIPRFSSALGPGEIGSPCQFPVPLEWMLGICANLSDVQCTCGYWRNRLFAIRWIL